MNEAIKSRLAMLAPSQPAPGPRSGTGSAPGSEKFQATDLLGATSVVHPLMLSYIMIRYTGAEHGRSFRLQMLRYVLAWGKLQGWPSDKTAGGWTGERAEAFTDLLMHELLDPQRCKRCKGRREVMNREKTVKQECPRCNGTGKETMTGRQKARATGIDQNHWFRGWGLRYEQLAQFWLQWEQEELHKINQMLGGKGDALVLRQR